MRYSIKTEKEGQFIKVSFVPDPKGIVQDADFKPNKEAIRKACESVARSIDEQKRQGR